MNVLICFLLGLVIGALCTLPLLLHKLRLMKEKARTLESQAASLRDVRERVLAKQNEVDQRARDQVLLQAEIQRTREELGRRIISYDELHRENIVLKRDLRNIDVHLQKTRLDHDVLGQRQRQLDARGEDLARRYLRDTLKAVTNSLNPNNFAACKDRLVDVIARCREAGFNISADEEAALVADLKANYERVVKAALEREEQARIRAQIREEEKLRREVERELERTERERLAIQAALDQAMAQAKDLHSVEVEQLRAKLAEAEARSARAVSMAQQTKAGHVYVTSNIGSFGKGVYKVGMTRRLEPLDRIKELGDASVPFPFDVHMMISCDDAPTLENALHRALHKMRINRVNPKKEFFRTDLDTILEVVRAHHGHVEYVADPEALEYNQSLAMSEEDADYVEAVYDAAEADAKTGVED